MKQTLSDTNKNIEELTQYLLINQLCGINQTAQLPFNYSYLSFNKDKKKEKKLSYNVAGYLNPFFMVMKKEKSQGEQSLQRQLQECVKNSKLSESLQILLNNVLQLPKLRYQQSEKLFQVQTQKDAYNFSSTKTPKNLDFQIPSQVFKKTEETELSSDFPYAKSIAEQLTPKEGKKIIDLNVSSFQEQMDIQINMSARSQRSNREFIDNKSSQNFGSENQLEKQSQKTQMMKRKQKDTSSHIFFQTQSQKMAKQQKNFIQNYFQSAKNQIMDHCSLNCCQGMFGKQQTKNKKMMTINEMKGIQLKKDQKQYTNF